MSETFNDQQMKEMLANFRPPIVPAEAKSSFAEPAGSATGYKSVCELASDNPNLSEYLAQLEKMLTDINRIDEWARKIWGSVCLLGPEDQDRLAQIIDACEKWRQSPNDPSSLTPART